MTKRNRVWFAMLPAMAALSGCEQQSPQLTDRQQIVQRCESLAAQRQDTEAVACLLPFETDEKPDAQTAAAVFQLGQLYENGRGVPADTDHALRLYRQAEKLTPVAPEIGAKASKSATEMINRLRQAEEP